MNVKRMLSLVMTCLVLAAAISALSPAAAAGSADERISGLEERLDALVETVPVYGDWTEYACTGTEKKAPKGMRMLSGYMRESTANRPGRLVAKASYRTYYIRTAEECAVYLTVDNGEARLRVSKEKPAIGTGKSFTGQLYDKDTGLPTEDSPLIVEAGMYIAWCNGTAGDGSVLHVAETVSETDALRSNLGLTPAMRTETENLFPARAGYLEAKLVWQAGNINASIGADIRAATDQSAERKTCQTLLFPYRTIVRCGKGWGVRVTVADRNYTIVEAPGGLTHNVYRIMEAGVPYRLTVQNETGEDMTGLDDDAMAEHVKVCALYENPAAPVRWCALGDSITQGWHSEMDESSGKSVSKCDPAFCWAATLSVLRGWELTNLARGGIGWIDEANTGDNSAAWYVARHTDFAPYQLVTLALGINDWKAHASPVGTWEDAPTDDAPTTVMQAMRATIEAIYASNPACKIVVILPLNCNGYTHAFGDKSTNYALGYSFSLTGTLEDFVARMIEVCDYYGIEYIDLTHRSVINRETLSTLLPDGVHPSYTAHELLAHELAKKIPFD